MKIVGFTPKTDTILTDFPIYLCHIRRTVCYISISEYGYENTIRYGKRIGHRTTFPGGRVPDKGA